MTFLVKGLSFGGLAGAALVRAGWLGWVFSGVPALAGVGRRLLRGAGVNPEREMSW